MRLARRRATQWTMPDDGNLLLAEAVIGGTFTYEPSRSKRDGRTRRRLQVVERIAATRLHPLFTWGLIGGIDIVTDTQYAQPFVRPGLTIDDPSRLAPAPLARHLRRGDWRAFRRFWPHAGSRFDTREEGVFREAGATASNT